MNSFKATKAERKKLKVKMCLQGVPGSGKTTGALLIASGIEPDWNKIAFIDTENESALYNVGAKIGDCTIGEFMHIPFDAPYTPERYIEAMRYAASLGCTVVVCDSITHEWNGSGGILEVHGKMPGNSFTNWAKLTPRHNRFVDTMRSLPVHIIACARTKQEHVIEQGSSGKQAVKKKGMKTEQREGMEYEFGLVFDIEREGNLATAGKDRTHLFNDRDAFRITPDTGREILQWAESGKAVDMIDAFSLSNILHKQNLVCALDELDLEYDADRKKKLAVFLADKQPDGGNIQELVKCIQEFDDGITSD